MLRRDYLCFMAGTLAAVPVVPVLAVFFFPPTERPLVWVVTLFGALLIAFGSYWFQVRPIIEVVAKGRVEVVQGTATWRRGWLHIDGHRMPISKRSQAASSELPPIVEGQPCRAYLAPRGRLRFLAVEPIDS